MRSAPIIDAVLKSIASAQREYENWSGGAWLWEAPEYMATTGIARAVQGIESVAYVTMENNVRTAIKDAGGNVVGRRNARLSLEGRFDVVVWNITAPRGLIEVKTSVGGYSSVRKDVRKLCTALMKANDIRWGLVAYFLSFADGERKAARDRLADRTANIARRAAEDVPREFRLKRRNSTIRVNDDGAWTTEVLEIRRVARA